MSELTGYSLTDSWFKFCKSGEHVVRPIHTAFYLYCVYLCNKMQWKKNFGLPTEHTMDVLGFKNKKTYYLVLQELIDFGFILMVEKSINQHTANIICLPKKRTSTHLSTHLSTVPIVKRIKLIKTLVNEGELKTVLVNLFEKVRIDVPRGTLEYEAGKFLNKYGNKDPVKDINLINAWAEKIKHIAPLDKVTEFDKIAKANKIKYGS